MAAPVASPTTLKSAGFKATDPAGTASGTVATAIAGAPAFGAILPSGGIIGGAAAGATVTCTLPAVAVGTPGALVIAATVDSLVAPGTVLTNTASVTADETDPVPGNNSDSEDTVITQINDLAVSKSASPEPAVAGEQVTWTITGSNNGPSNATNITVQDQLPAGVSFASGDVGQHEIRVNFADFRGVVALSQCRIFARWYGDERQQDGTKPQQRCWGIVFALHNRFLG